MSGYQEWRHDKDAEAALAERIRRSRMTDAEKIEEAILGSRISRAEYRRLQTLLACALYPKEAGR